LDEAWGFGARAEIRTHQAGCENMYETLADWRTLDLSDGWYVYTVFSLLDPSVVDQLFAGLYYFG
jgi:hypothetical protein